jgi:tetratricopeptide (TPR) repeat protein
MGQIVPFLIAVASIAQIGTPQLTPQQQQAASEHFTAGMQALRGERYDEAEERFRNAVRIDPLYDAAFYGLGQVYMATKRYDKATKAYLDARDAFKSSVAGEKLDSAVADRRVRDQIQALRDHVRQMERMPPGRNPGLQADLDRNRTQIRQLEARLNRNNGEVPPVPAGLSFALGSAYFRSGDLQSAEREYLEAVKVEPKFGEAHSNLAVVYLLTGRLDEAERAVKAAEKAGFQVNPRLKEDIQQRKKGGTR